MCSPLPIGGGGCLPCLCVAVFAINLDGTIVNVALPTLVRELGASTSRLQWVVDAYQLAFCALVLAAGSLSDRFGRKGALIAGLAIFGVGSVAGSLGTSTGQLIAARAVMGVGAAIVFPNTLSILSNVFTDRVERAKAIGAWGATTGMGVAFGPDRRRLAPRAVLVGQRVPGDGAGRGRRRSCWSSRCVPTRATRRAPRSTWSAWRLSTVAIGVLVYTIIEAPDARMERSRPRWPASPSLRRAGRCSSRGSGGSRSRCSTSACSRTCGSPRPAALSPWRSSRCSASSS